MMTLSDARIAIMTRISKFTGMPKTDIQIDNQPTIDGKPFIAPKDKLWCKASIQFNESSISSLGDTANVRVLGIVSIQCFAPLNSGTAGITQLCDDWFNWLQSFSVGDLEIYLAHAPQDIDDNDFYAKIIRAEFRVN